MQDCEDLLGSDEHASREGVLMGWRSVLQLSPFRFFIHKVKLTSLLYHRLVTGFTELFLDPYIINVQQTSAIVNIIIILFTLTLSLLLLFIRHVLVPLRSLSILISEAEFWTTHLSSSELCCDAMIHEAGELSSQMFAR